MVQLSRIPLSYHSSRHIVEMTFGPGQAESEVAFCAARASLTRDLIDGAYRDSQGLDKHHGSTPGIAAKDDSPSADIGLDQPAQACCYRESLVCLASILGRRSKDHFCCRFGSSAFLVLLSRRLKHHYCDVHLAAWSKQLDIKVCMANLCHLKLRFEEMVNGEKYGEEMMLSISSVFA